MNHSKKSYRISLIEKELQSDFTALFNLVFKT